MHNLESGFYLDGRAASCGLDDGEAGCDEKGGSGDPKSHAMKKHLWAISETLVPDASIWNT